MKDDRVYLGHILRCIARIEEYTVEGRDKFFASHLKEAREAALKELKDQK